MNLYHGSNVEIVKIDLGSCRPWKDFGRGFYTSPSQDQALKMAKRTVRIYGGRPYVTVFAFDDDLLTNSLAATSLKIKIFGSPDNEWARFVVNNRNRDFKDKQSPDCNIDAKYDIVLGPVANDDIAALISIFLSGLITDDALTKELTIRELSNQVSFHTEKSVACLRKTEVIMAKSKIEMMMELVTADVVSAIAEETAVPVPEAMKLFYNSEVFDRLRDVETGLYRESGGYVYDLFKIERQYGRLVQLEV